MRSRSFLRQALHVCTAIAAIASAVACGSPTAPESQNAVDEPTTLRLSSAQVVVAGQVVNGQTLQQGQMHGSSTFFQATLAGPDGPAPGHAVHVEYQLPGAGMGQMMGTRGTLHLYDDGTHGDPVAGDGVYCFEDQQGHYGFHMQNAPNGQYHYEFFGIHHDGHHSNHMNVVVTIASG